MLRTPRPAAPTRAQVAEAVTAMADQFAALASQATDPNRMVPATPTWSVTDVVGHVAMEPWRYRELALGRGAWPAKVADLPAFNAEQVRALPSRELSTLTETLRADTAALVATVTDFGDRPPWMNFDGDQRVRADRALGTLLGEFLVHGHDIARTLGQPWPIDGAYVPMVLAGLHQVLPGWVNPATAGEHTVTYELRLRGLARYRYVFTDGRLAVNPPHPGRIDVRITADPATALLLVYGRMRPWRAALTGKVYAWGRRPWLGLSFAERFHSA